MKWLTYRAIAQHNRVMMLPFISLAHTHAHDGHTNILTHGNAPGGPVKAPGKKRQLEALIQVLCKGKFTGVKHHSLVCSSQRAQLPCSQAPFALTYCSAYSIIGQSLQLRCIIPAMPVHQHSLSSLVPPLPLSSFML